MFSFLLASRSLVLPYPTRNRYGVPLEFVERDLDVKQIYDFSLGLPVRFLIREPLSAEALAVLKRRKKASENEWVFPAHHGGGHVKDVYRAWRGILKRAGIKDLRVHDLRRTLGSWQTMTGASRAIVGKLLGHTREETTAIYGRLDLEPVRESVETATAAMLKAAKKR